MNRRINTAYICGVLGSYQKRMAEIRQQIRRLYKEIDPDRDEEDDWIRSVSLPRTALDPYRAGTGKDMIDVLQQYRDSLDGMKKRALRRMELLLEEQESMERIMTCFEILPYAERKIMGEIYVDKEEEVSFEGAARDLMKKYRVSFATIKRIRRTALQKILENYFSTLTNSELLRRSALGKGSEMEMERSHDEKTECMEYEGRCGEDDPEPEPGV